MHLNALYRVAQAGRRALADCEAALAKASRWPVKYWHLRRARRHLDTAKQHLRIVRENVVFAATFGDHRDIDSSGGFQVADLLCGGLLDRLGDVEVGRVDATRGEVSGLLSQVGELLLRMRKAGAVS